MKSKSLNKKDNSNLNFFKTLVTSLVIILIFSVLPISVDFIKKNLQYLGVGVL